MTTQKKTLERGALQKILLDAMRGSPQTFADLAKVGMAHGSTKKSVSVALPRMRKRKLIHRNADGLYGLVSSKASPAPAPKAPSTKYAAAEKKGRWKPGEFQALLVKELKMAPRTRSDLYRRFPTTGRTTIVAALKVVPEITEKDGVYSYDSSKNLLVRKNHERLETDLNALRKMQGKKPRVLEDLMALVDTNAPVVESDLAIAVALAEIRGRMSQLPVQRRSFVQDLANLLASGKITVDA